MTTTMSKEKINIRQTWRNKNTGTLIKITGILTNAEIAIRYPWLIGQSWKDVYQAKDIMGYFDIWEYDLINWYKKEQTDE